MEGYLKVASLHAKRILIETGASAPLEQRPSGGELLDMVRKGKVRHVIALNAGSLFRSAREMVSTIAEWEKAGVVLHLMDFCGQTLNTCSPAGEMLLGIANALVELDRSGISRSIASRKRLGGVSGPTPYGYEKFGGKLIPEQQESMVLENMKAARAEGMSLTSIARFLNDAGVPCKKGGKQWYPTTVKKILERQVNVPQDPGVES
jgi:DNA invertase Pin-like site-specific DNA recombinase